MWEASSESYVYWSVSPYLRRIQRHEKKQNIYIRVLGDDSRAKRLNVISSPAELLFALYKPFSFPIVRPSAKAFFYFFGTFLFYPNTTPVRVSTLPESFFLIEDLLAEPDADFIARGNDWIR